MKITVQVISMNQCSHDCSAAMRVAAACRFSWRTAGPPGRSFTAWAEPAAVATAAASSSPGAAWMESLFIVLSLYCQNSLALRATQCPPQFLREHRPQFRAHIAPHAHAPALAGHLDQRPVSRARL